MWSWPIFSPANPSLASTKSTENRQWHALGLIGQLKMTVTLAGRLGPGQSGAVAGAPADAAVRPRGESIM